MPGNSFRKCAQKPHFQGVGSFQKSAMGVQFFNTAAYHADREYFGAIYLTFTNLKADRDHDKK